MTLDTTIGTAEHAEDTETSASRPDALRNKVSQRRLSRIPFLSVYSAYSAVPLAAFALAAVVGCRAPSSAPASHQDHARERTAIENRAALVFTNAILIKPQETLPAMNLAFTLAPLVIKEVAGPNSVSNCGPATIYYEFGAAHIAGVTHPQMTYVWFERKDKKRWHGVRLTLDSHGLPVIWEVLSDRSGLRVLFVSRSLEAKAQAAFGAPAPGRHFSIEQRVSQAPDVVVARTIEDGPVAMGPIVQETASGEITTVICRCMPTQARILTATEYYELKPLSSSVDGKLHLREPVQNLDSQLRLPPAF